MNQIVKNESYKTTSDETPFIFIRIKFTRIPRMEFVMFKYKLDADVLEND